MKEDEKPVATQIRSSCIMRDESGNICKLTLMILLKYLKHFLLKNYTPYNKENIYLLKTFYLLSSAQ